jgi:hypothetical protein
VLSNFRHMPLLQRMIAGQTGTDEHSGAGRLRRYSLSVTSRNRAADQEKRSEPCPIPVNGSRHS